MRRDAWRHRLTCRLRCNAAISCACQGNGAIMQRCIAFAHGCWKPRARIPPGRMPNYSLHDYLYAEDESLHPSYESVTPQYQNNGCLSHIYLRLHPYDE
ncbi:protein of unknown function [Cupriavidus neocaledonicus]|uniref:Uncharacterized protein n=1 Tax=Cupriavidus neocaledonicus TaxID=1040979 RepID=A0A375HDZ1_9BURK|nr:protein of unknown function [Cupriavidus neocaledonicus]